MKLILSATKRSPTITWICYACRGFKILKTTNRLMTGPAARLRDGGPLRTRFAPSPTGELHLGSLRTALFNYLAAKASGGQFILRIEDTDQKRSLPEAESHIYRDLKWAGITWDEGPGVGGPHGSYRQSDRTAIYEEHVEKLLQSGHAYRCFCPAERLHNLMTQRMSEGIEGQYDRKCFHISKAESDDRASKTEKYVVRLVSPERFPHVTDLNFGTIRTTFHNTSKKPPKDAFEDPILMKTDGFPTYHLANVVDDHLMQITHVIRGAEWMPSTPKHVTLYDAFGWEPPKFVHVGLLLNTEKHKLSKRDGSLSVDSYRAQGYFPEALSNFLALLGWSHDQHNDVLGREELIENASLKYTTSNPIVTFQKLRFLQRHYAARYAALSRLEGPVEPFRDLKILAVKPIYDAIQINQKSTPATGAYEWFNETFPSQSSQQEYIEELLLEDIRVYITPEDFIKRNIYFFTRPSKADIRLSFGHFVLRNIPSGVQTEIPSKLIEALLDIKTVSTKDWTHERVREHIKWIITEGTTITLASISTEMKEKLDMQLGWEEVIKKSWMKLVYKYFRWALCAGNVGPDVSFTMHALGKEETMTRLLQAAAEMEKALASSECGEDAVVPPNTSRPT